MTRIQLDLPEAFHKHALALAKKDGVSVKQLITSALAEKMSTLDAENYIQMRAKRGSRARYLAVLKKAGDRPPMKGDELPADLARKVQRRLNSKAAAKRN